MGLLKKITNRVLGTKSKPEISDEKKALLRSCYFEVMEQRRVLSADPVIAAVTYLEGDAGQDTTPDHFEVTFQGGADATQMTQFTINGDQDSSGDLSDGDMFFDVNSSLPGTGGYHQFTFDAANSQGVAASDISSFSVSDNGLLLQVEVDNFTEGDVIAFTIDVDEVERFRVDKIASGVEFEGSFFEAKFVDQNYTFAGKDVAINATLEDGFVQPQSEGIFFDEYNQLFAEGESLSLNSIDLTLDNEEGNSDRTAGAIDAYDLVPKPVTISGTIYHDEDLDCVHDADEDGIEGVEVQLMRLDETTGEYSTVAVTTTDANGNYEFGEDLNLTPGKFKLVEVQPDGYLDVGAEAGSHGGNVVQGINEDANVIADINIPLGGTAATDYDFKEVRPASISGHVWHDENNDGVFDANEKGIANVLIQVTRVGAKAGVTSDPFANSEPILVRTDANGFYEVDALPPGIYEIVEINEYVGEVDPLAAYLDGKDSIGNIDANTVGTKSNDKFTQIELCADDNGVEYNFGEILPAELKGTVWHDANNDGVIDVSEDRIGNVVIELFDKSGNKIAETTTDAEGNYCFEDLYPGDYLVKQSQPNGFLDGQDSLGDVDGVQRGEANDNDEFCVTLEAGDSGQNYDFGEILPAQLKGTVWHDSNNDGVIDASEDRIGGVVIELFDKSGNKIAETTTDAQGNYCFEDLYPGDYLVRETQPTGFQDGIDTIGQVNGIGMGEVIGNDEFCVTLESGDEGTNYNFGELKPASISGTVHADANGDCVFDPSAGDLPLEGVELVLLDGNGNQVSRTFTDANGNYSFDDLVPGTYSVREVTPDGYLDGGGTIGTVDGIGLGTLGQDVLNGIKVNSGDQAVDYDFCEHIPAELCGTVYHDRNNNGVQDNGEEGIEGTRMVLTDENGKVIAETFTDAQGEYCFENLFPGTYCVKEIQPTGFVDGKDSVGSVDGIPRGQGSNDEVCNIELTGGDEGNEYNFGELQLAEISGQVHVDVNGDCVFDPAIGERALADVEIELLDANGDVVATTTTDANGNYKFTNILPGEYSVRETQPEGLFNGGEVVGSNGGKASENLIENIVVTSGQKLTHYNFCEVEAAEIHGRVWEDGPAIETEDGTIPDNYRNLRDGIYQAGTDTPLEGVRMQLYYYIDPTSGSVVPRPVTLGEVQAEHYDHMGTTDPDAPVWVETMANGEYWFLGLHEGRYIVLENQPDGYVDSTDTPGTTQGFSYNSFDEVGQAPAAIISTFSTEQILDSVVNINLQSGGISESNNFSELRFVTSPTDPPTLIPPPIPQPPTVPGNPLTPRPGITGYPGLAGSQPTAFTSFVGTSRGASFQTRADVAAEQAYTWHLSVVNGGLPRGAADGVVDESVWQQAGYIFNADWSSFDMDDAVWTFSETRDSDSQIVKTANQLRFGMFGGIPLAGDFDGDGTDEVAIYKDGYWMIDINRNGTWDETDLLAKLGDSEDRPVVGDWDGDGKDDIGIYGPIWALDDEAIARDPGLPNPDNGLLTKPKNVPPTNDAATNGARIMKLTSYGKQRADVVDHVFGYGEEEEIPVTGDWNGNGIRSIGTFEAGVWNLDVNGDGRFDHEDVTVNFGNAGDIPVVGDFNGDGIEQIAVYRSGTWMIDTDGNRELDATDQTFQMGGVFDKPVVGDWDGDGVDEPAVYTEQSNDGIE